MTAVLTARPTIELHRLESSRPPYRTWEPSPPVPVEPRRSELSAVDATGADPRAADPSTAGRRDRVVVTRAGWCARPDPSLPAVGLWSGSLAVAVVEALLARRPVAQLNRWLSDEVLAEVTRHQRLRLSGDAPAGRPVLVSVHVQHPSARAAEVAVHLRADGRAVAMALRLEALGERWLCTALALGPRPERTT